jgi:hypothetical protein
VPLFHCRLFEPLPISSNVLRREFSHYGRGSKLAHSKGTVLRAADLQLALQKAGVSDEAIPREWDGAQLTLQIGATVMAEWHDVALMQGLPPVLSTPPGFDLQMYLLYLPRVGDASPDKRCNHTAAARYASSATPIQTHILRFSET